MYKFRDNWRNWRHTSYSGGVTGVYCTESLLRERVCKENHNATRYYKVQICVYGDLDGIQRNETMISYWVSSPWLMAVDILVLMVRASYEYRRWCLDNAMNKIKG